MNLINKIKEKFSCGFWNIGIIELPIGDLINGNKNYSIKWMKHNFKNSFFADPFPIGEDKNNYYILAEEYNFYKSKGIIVKLTISKKEFKLIEKQKYIETKYHLSFPYPYRDCVIPEQFRSSKLYAYKNGDEQCICDYPVIDPTLFEYHGEEYLIGNMINNENIEANKNLFIFKKNGDKYKLLSDVPIKSDISSSRSAGKFFEFNGELYRPVQDCRRIYGDQVKIMKITNIGIDWKESEIAVINSKKSKDFNEGLHTLNKLGDIVIVDGFSNQYRGWRKLTYAIYRYLKYIL